MSIWIQKCVLVENAVQPFLARLISHLLLIALSDKNASKAKETGLRIGFETNFLAKSAHNFRTIVSVLQLCV
ncbi:MAG: hypothetical protein CMN10_08075 [Roseobacter sp.]|nr:hypothetical protein [Roseobacter sp.]